VGGVPFMVKHNDTALLVNAGASDQMAAAIVRIYNDEPLRNNLVTAGIEEVSQYTWPQVRLLWLNLYREAAGGGVL
jgi:glycosyltransferase involved in cell wall biosynthesis